MRIWTMTLRELGSSFGDGPENWNIDPRLILFVSPSRKASPDAGAFKCIFIVGQPRRDEERSLVVFITQQICIHQIHPSLFPSDRQQIIVLVGKPDGTRTA